MRITIFLLLAMGCLVCCSSAHSPTYTPAGDEESALPPVVLHRRADLKPETVALSHAGEESWSVLQPIYGQFSILPHTFLTEQVPAESTGQKTAIYPRIKKMADGKYLMLYHGGRLGTRCFATISSDLIHWSTPVMLFGPERVQVAGEADWRRYVNPDAVVMPDGEIIAVFSYRDTDHYSKGIGGGLVLRRSKDNGQTWSAPETIYEGTNWEPYLLLLPDGRLQCYFTDAIPMTRNSGTSVLVSKDRGKTWSGKIRCSRLYKYDYDGPNTEYAGQRIFTDQMPCFRVLGDGKTLVGFLEDRLEDPESNQGSSYYMISLVYNDGPDWKPLSPDEAGPAERQDKLLRAAAGYVSVFPSGEVVLSCNINSVFSMMVGDASARHFNGPWEGGWFQPFEEKGYWGCTEVCGPNTLVAAMHGSSGMQIGAFWLNHRIDASRISVKVDGDGSEWTTGQALYLSTRNGCESLIRAARDGDYLYLLLDYSGQGEHALQVSSLSGKQLTINVDASGNLTCTSPGVSGISRAAKAADGTDGFVTEIAVPLNELGAREGEYVYLYATLSRGDVKEAFTSSNTSDVNTWQRIKL